MDEEFCDIVNPAISLTAQVSSILVLSHVFQILLKPLGQHAPVAQILVCPSIFSHVALHPLGQAEHKRFR